MVLQLDTIYQLNCSGPLFFNIRHGGQDTADSSAYSRPSHTVMFSQAGRIGSVHATPHGLRLQSNTGPWFPE